MKQLATILLIFVTTSIEAQENFKTNHLYFEFLGNGIGSSISFEKQVAKKPGLGFRIGVGYLSSDSKFRASAPLGVNYLFALKNTRSFLDCGLGATWSEANAIKLPERGVVAGSEPIEYIWSFVPSVGLRHHTKGNFMWRTSFTPIINRNKTFPWIGLSIGKSF